MHSSDFENAKHIFEVLFRKSPDYHIVHYHLGAIALQTGEFKKALKHFNHLEKHIDDDAEIYFYKGVAYYRQGEYIQAKDAFGKILAINPEHSKAKTYYEDCLYELETLL